MGRLVKLAASTINQWALDFKGNYERILSSIQEAKENGARFRSGPELEICGYSCEDHFYECDTLMHCWEVLADILLSPLCNDMMIDVGMPILHRDLTYSCRVIFLNRKILMIRPKMVLREDGHYRETRWFSPWRKVRQIDEFVLPRMITAYTGQKVVPIGDAILCLKDTCIGFEMCAELWNPESPHIHMGLEGVEIIANGAANYFELKNAHATVDLIKSATFKSGGCYLFSNMKGCDGQRVYFNGCPFVTVNGHLTNRGKAFSLSDVEVVVATIDLEDIRTYRNAICSRTHALGDGSPYPRIPVEFSLSDDAVIPCIVPIQWQYLSTDEEIEYAPACWIWDYLRRSGKNGFFLPLSGGMDSSAVACIVYSMCNMIIQCVELGDEKVLAELRRIIAEPSYEPTTATELCHRLLITCFMSTENCCSFTSARSVAEAIGSNHINISLDSVVSSATNVFVNATKTNPRPRRESGDDREETAIQSVQGRLRMVLSHLFAELLLWTKDKPGSLLVLSSCNIDKELKGQMFKYDCSSADINPIGGISKADLRSFLSHMARKFEIPILLDVLSTSCSQEKQSTSGSESIFFLLPKDDQERKEEVEITYTELNQLMKLRKQHFCGPFSMFCKLAHSWKANLPPREVAEKVKKFFVSYSRNRHKMAVLTPFCHADSCSPDDNRYDHRPFLYCPTWDWQFRAINDELERLSPSEFKMMKTTGDSLSKISPTKTNRSLDIVPKKKTVIDINRLLSVPKTASPIPPIRAQLKPPPSPK